ncbi:AAA family ATPase, partial [Candidatus Venteria ishoeyi]
MDSHLLQEIEIKNFKCFDNFKASGFKRVNLIGGKNNVGKTALMEACFINVHAQDIKKFTGALVDIKRMRETLNRLMAFIQDKNKSISVQTYLEKNNHFFSSSNI